METDQTSQPAACGTHESKRSTARPRPAVRTKVAYLLEHTARTPAPADGGRMVSGDGPIR
ncbi:hypothetical protein P0D87_17985 [Paraburkholderia sp. RL17-368-BIF-A]|nr:hypothetical protein AC233_29695 [Burkholderia sp. HB1]